MSPSLVQTLREQKSSLPVRSTQTGPASMSGAGLPAAAQAGLAGRRAQGIDVSNWQYQINPQRATQSLDFIIYKASESTYKDKSFDKHYASTASVPIKGAYHFIQAGNVNAQVNAFLDSVMGKKLDFYAVDLEKNDVTGAPTSSMLAQDAREFIRQVNQKTGKPVLLYTNTSTYNQYFNRPGDEKIPLWIADPSNSATNPRGINRDWAIWQSSWTAPASQFGGSRYDKGFDFNVFAGTPADMRAWLNSITKNQAFDLSATAARTAGSTVGIQSPVTNSVPLIKPIDYTSLFRASSLPSATATGQTGGRTPSTNAAPRTGAPLVQQTQTSTGTTGGRTTSTNAAPRTPASPSNLLNRAADVMKGKDLTTDKTSPLEKILGIDLLSLGLILTGIILVIVGLVILTRGEAPREVE